MSKIELRGTIVESNPELINKNNRNIKRNKGSPRTEQQRISAPGIWKILTGIDLEEFESVFRQSVFELQPRIEGGMSLMLLPPVLKIRTKSSEHTGFLRCEPNRGIFGKQ
jgi:hypothetical protein